MPGRQQTSDLFEILRTRTAPAHRRLEARLGLLEPPLIEARFQHMLERLLGLHRAWEPTLCRYPGLAPVLKGRSRLTPIARDLAALGLSPEAIAAAPSCPLVDHLPQGQAAALGALYVTEGSTLGGEVIARAIVKEPWAPDEGLETFRPYGSRTGVMWRDFKRLGRDLAPPAAWPDVEDGAQAMFDLLTLWLPGSSAA